jgi:hypothetical protein
MRLAPKKKGLTGTETLPEITKLMNLINDDSREAANSPREEDVRSFRCCRNRPSGPPADPVGKEEIAFATQVGETARGSCRGWSRGKDASGLRDGCFSLRRFRDFSSELQKESVELAVRTAP